MYQNIITQYFQNFIKNKDIRNFQNNYYYYLLFRLVRRYLNSYLEVKIFNFKILASNKKNKTSHALLKKCDFDDQSELQLINLISKKRKVLLIDCGCNYGFYSFYTASLSKQNLVIAVEASPTTAKDFKKNLNLNKFSNIVLKKLAISSIDNMTVPFNESKNDWESSLTHNEFDKKRVIKIKTQKIDTILKNQKIDDYFLFIKLDIEGNELQAIEGAKNTIKKFNPIIIIELSSYILKKNKDFDYLKFFLKEFDYNIYDTKKKLVPVNDIINLIKKLDTQHKTIGNYYLINNGIKSQIF
ncbi:FkbM family methyltransferase [Candidatus Pelagibacter sp. Uisw_106]|uniref:FkbM family methyltransferase n=1 Tax=Candidatus Pelagibacter sp. Uisw_106 TaxID=3230984 RepID=UPI002339A28D|nr:FkbM family methyltransferase [Candidatus Pelagibacter sp.]|tara:strand:+ start:47 stop:943 length:897 start_codon:yes stop_codon:yes gene_type:complete